MNSKPAEPKQGNVTPQKPEPELDIQFFFQVLLKRKWLILTVMLLVVCLVSAYTFSRVKYYRAVTSVLVDKRAPQVLGKDVREVVDLNMGNYWSNKEYMKTQEKVITSKNLAKQVAEELKLATNEAFWPPTSKGKKGKKRRFKPTLNMAALHLQGMIKAKNLKESDIIEVSVEHHNPQLAAQLSNAVARTFRDQNLRYKVEETRVASKWLSGQLDKLKKKLEQEELDLYNFKKANNIISVSLESRQNLLASRITKLNDALTEIRVKRMYLTSQRRELQLAMKQDALHITIGPVMTNTTIQALKTAYVLEKKKLEALKSNYLHKHPVLLKQQAKVASARQDLDREVKNVLKALDFKHKATKETEGKLAAALQRSKTEALELNKREVGFRKKQRSQENTSKLYSMLLLRISESGLSEKLKVNNIRLLDLAEVPTWVVRPKVTVNLLIGGFLGLILAIGLAFLVETLDRTVKSQEDIHNVPGLIYLGLVPKIPGTPNKRTGKRPAPKPEVDLIVHHNPKSPVSESCRSIRTNLLFASPDRVMNRILVTSSGPREGKTTTAVSLAITMAQAGSRVLIMDTDMRRPRMHKIFGVPGTEGLTSCLSGETSALEAVKTTDVNNLYLLPCGPTPPNPAEICQSKRFYALLEELGEHFDRVILDSPPVMVVTDAVVLSTMSDGTLLVARTGQTTRVALKEATRQLLDVSANILGCVLNDMDLEKKGYGYYRYRRYGYYRYGSYRYTYGQYGDKNEEEAPG